MTESVIDTPAAPPPPAPPVEAAPTPPAPATPVADEGPLAPRFAALSKREKELTLREKRLKDDATAREAQLTTREKELADKIAQSVDRDDLLAMAKERPTEFFKRTGLTFQQLTDAVLREGETPTADDRVSKLEARLEAEAKARAEAETKAAKDAEERAAKANEKAIADFKSSIGQFVTANAETYELVHAEEATDLVFDLVAEHYARTSTALPVDKAAAMAEDYLFELSKKRYGSSKKLAALFAPPPAPPPAIVARPLSGAAAASVAAKKAPTLTNATGVSGTAPPAKKPMLSAREIADQYRKAKRGGTAVRK